MKEDVEDVQGSIEWIGSGKAINGNDVVMVDFTPRAGNFSWRLHAWEQDIRARCLALEKGQRVTFRIKLFKEAGARSGDYYIKYRHILDIIDETLQAETVQETLTGIQESQINYALKGLTSTHSVHFVEPKFNRDIEIVFMVDEKTGEQNVAFFVKGDDVPVIVSKSTIQYLYEFELDGGIPKYSKYPFSNKDDFEGYSDTVDLDVTGSEFAPEGIEWYTFNDDDPAD